MEAVWLSTYLGYLVLAKEDGALLAHPVPFDSVIRVLLLSIVRKKYLQIWTSTPGTFLL